VQRDGPRCRLRPQFLHRRGSGDVEPVHRPDRLAADGGGGDLVGGDRPAAVPAAIGAYGRGLTAAQGRCGARAYQVGGGYAAQSYRMTMRGKPELGVVSERGRRESCVLEVLTYRPTRTAVVLVKGPW